MFASASNTEYNHLLLVKYLLNALLKGRIQKRMRQAMHPSGLVSTLSEFSAKISEHDLPELCKTEQVIILAATRLT